MATAMKRSLYSFLLLIALVLPVYASENTDSLTWHDLRVQKYREHWGALIPTQSIIQYAGNMGLISVGAGWNYGKHKRWETQLLFGILPKHRSDHAKMTMTIKQNFIPWSNYLAKGWAVEPLSCGIYLNTIFGNQFWNNEPARYPENYYPFLSTKVRLNIFVGQRFEWTIPNNKAKLAKSITAFYEISACDLHLRSLFQDKHIKLHEILSLSVGLKFQLF